MKGNTDILQRIKIISKLMGEKTVFRIGVDSKEGKINLLSADACLPRKTSTKGVATEIPDYIG